MGANTQVAVKNAKATAYANATPYMALYSTAPTSSAAGTELSGGSPAYARIASGWGTAASGAVSTGALAFNVPSGATVAGGGFHTASTAGSYLDGFSLTSQAFSSQGTYTCTASETET